MPTLFHNCGELGVATAAILYLISATSTYSLNKLEGSWIYYLCEILVYGMLGIPRI